MKTYRGDPVRLYPACRRTVKIDLVECEPGTRVAQEVIDTLTINLPFPQLAFRFSKDERLLAYFINSSGDAVPNLLPNIEGADVCLEAETLDEAISAFWQSHFYESPDTPWIGTEIAFCHFCDDDVLKGKEISTHDDIVKIFRRWSRASHEELDRLIDSFKIYDFECERGSIPQFLKDLEDD